MLAVAREVTHRYVDPLAQIWLAAARRIGLRVVRSPDAYAATDGGGTLAIGSDATLDADDSLAQMIFHELCHSLVEGEAAFARPDWGMDNTGPDHDWREHACLRVQWVLAGRHGLRAVFAPTTEFRAFWDRLAGDVLADRADPSVQAAIAGLRRVDAAAVGARRSTRRSRRPRRSPRSSRGSRCRPPAACARCGSAWSRRLRRIRPGSLPAPLAPPAQARRQRSRGTCGTCVWRSNARCRQADAKIDPAWPACERFEAALDCQTCGACCRAAYHSVEVSRRDPVVKARPELIVDRGSYLEIQRNGDRCAALEGGAVEHATTTRYRCTIYDDRPRTCRDFTLGSAHCLTARRRVGLSL